MCSKYLGSRIADGHELSLEGLYWTCINISTKLLLVGPLQCAYASASLTFLG